MPAWLIPAALAAGAGISSYFGGKKAAKKRDTTPQIEQPPMPQETEAGAAALPILKARAQGQGVALPEERLSLLGQPYAEKAWRGWETRGRPELEEAFSARGLGRSTMAGQAIGEGTRDVLADVGINWAELQKWNEILRQSGIQSGLSGLSAFTGQELGQRGAQIGQKWQDYANQIAQARQGRQERAQVLPNALITAGNVYEGLRPKKKTALERLLERISAPRSVFTPTQATR